MSKNIHKKAIEEDKKIVSIPKKAPINIKHEWLPDWSIQKFYMLFIALTFLFYGNTIFHEYALDDGLVIGENKYTLKGIKGIPDILFHDSFQAFYESNNSNKNELSGGRWRPLSIISFAVEISFFGKNPVISHFINVCLYAFLICSLFYFLSQFIFKHNYWLAFFISLLFLIHPLHTESVANIKSRDELFSFIFIILFFIKSFSYVDFKNKKDLIWSIVYLALAFLSKENAITLCALYPLTLYVFRDMNFKESFQKSAPLFIVSFLYLVTRFIIVGKGSTEPVTELLNNPYAVATFEQKWASIFTLPLYYFKLLFFPYNMSYDYSYSQLPYESFTSLKFIFSLLLNGFLICYGIFRALKRDVIGYAILFFYISYSIISNVFIPLGATMGERLMFQASLGFCILIGILLNTIFEKYNVSKNVVMISIGLLTCLAAARTITRNMDWKNNTTLFLKDVKTCPESVKTNVAAATAIIGLYDTEKDNAKKESYFKESMQHLEKAEKIHPGFEDIYMNRGSMLWRVQKYDEAEKEWNRAREDNPNHSKFKEYDNILKQRYLSLGTEKGNNQQYMEAIPFMQKACEYGKNDAEAWYNLGGIAFMANQYDVAKDAITKCLAINPNHPQAKLAWEDLKKRIQ